MKSVGRRAYIALAGARQFVLAAALVAPAWGPAFAQAPAPPVVHPNLAYGPLPAEVGDLYLPNAAGLHPVVVIIHGGGWVAGSRAAYTQLAPLITAMGIAVFNIDYRLAQAQQPGTLWPAQLQDAQLAVRFLRAHAAEWSLDPHRFGALGDSAGAHLAVFLGVLHRVAPGDQAGLFADLAPDVSAVVDQFGPTDLAAMGGGQVGFIAGVFGTPAPTPEMMASASPLPLVSRSSAPVYILHGTQDQVVPFDQSLRLRDVLRAHGVAVTMVPFTGGHGYEGVPTETAGTLQYQALLWLGRQLWGGG